MTTFQKATFFSAPVVPWFAAVVSKRGTEGAERLRKMAIATRSYCPVHQFIVVIEARALSLLSSTLSTRRCVRKKCLLQLTGVFHICGMAPVECLRDGCQYSFLLSAPIHCCDRNACIRTDRIASYNNVLLLVFFVCDGLTMVPKK